MRKFKTMVTAVMMAALPVLLGSCDSDPYYIDDWQDSWTWGNDYNNRPDNGNVSNEDFFVSMAQTLAGKWRGDMMAYELDEKGNVLDSLYYSTDIEFKQYYLAGYELGVQKKDIVTAFIVSRGLFSTDYFDALHKRIYRQSQQTLDKLVKKLINKVDYINSSININGLKDDQNH